jgi:2-hydroxy-3-oxopropionate reductase
VSHSVVPIGAGAMGSVIGTRLAQTGNRLTVFDPDPARRPALMEFFRGPDKENF